LSRLQVAGEYATWTAPDPQTVVLTIKEPFAPFLFALSGIGIIPKHLLENSADLNTDPFNTAPIGSGPFKITEREVGVKTVYERFPDYHRGVAAAEGMVEVF
jgi:peptide/nickel transport system substrate-binding protein